MIGARRQACPAQPLGERFCATGRQVVVGSLAVCGVTVAGVRRCHMSSLLIDRPRQGLSLLGLHERFRQTLRK